LRDSSFKLPIPNYYYFFVFNTPGTYSIGPGVIIIIILLLLLLLLLLTQWEISRRIPVLGCWY